MTTIAVISVRQNRDRVGRASWCMLGRIGSGRVASSIIVEAEPTSVAPEPRWMPRESAFLCASMTTPGFAPVISSIASASSIALW